MTEELKVCITCEVPQPDSEYHTSRAKTRTECNTCRYFYNRLNHHAGVKNANGRKVIKLDDGSEVLLADAVRGLRLRGYKYKALKTRNRNKPAISDETAAKVVDVLLQKELEIIPPAETKEDK